MIKEEDVKRISVGDIVYGLDCNDFIEENTVTNVYVDSASKEKEFYRLFNTFAGAEVLNKKNLMYDEWYISKEDAKKGIEETAIQAIFCVVCGKNAIETMIEKEFQGKNICENCISIIKE